MSNESGDVKVGGWIKLLDSDGLDCNEYKVGVLYKVSFIPPHSELVAVVGKNGSFYKGRCIPVDPPESFEVGDEVIAKPGECLDNFTANKIYKVLAVGGFGAPTICLKDDRGLQKWLYVHRFELISARRLSNKSIPTILQGAIVVLRPEIQIPSVEIPDTDLAKEVPYNVERSDGEWLEIRGYSGILKQYGCMHFKKIDPTDPRIKVIPNLDLSKPIITRGGLPVEIISNKGRGKFPLIYYIGGSNDLQYCDLTGRKYDRLTPRSRDLINVPDKITVKPFKAYVDSNGDPVFFEDASGTRFGPTSEVLSSGSTVTEIEFNVTHKITRGDRVAI